MFLISFQFNCKTSFNSDSMCTLLTNYSITESYRKVGNNVASNHTAVIQKCAQMCVLQPHLTVAHPSNFRETQQH